ncbi:hypothetical protein FD754_011092 [Muntiacus muntjak]|uniref:Neuropeptide S n=1 Tax=Muntiacus muntjak TaxID=9888 RepID=A0A5N3VCU5_MUNMU|nr:hypothetical protein FD754_011092 [Muntiacus muntjak]
MIYSTKFREEGRQFQTVFCILIKSVFKKCFSKTLFEYWLYWIYHRKILKIVSGKSDYFVLLLNSCSTRMDRREALDFLKPILEKTLMKRSFRNGVGTGVKKTSFRRAKT